MAYYNRIFIGALACLFSITIFAADLPGNPADDTPQQSLDRWKQHFRNQDAYDRNAKEVIASIGKDSQGRQTIQQIVNKHAVLPDGSKAELKTVVTQIPDKAKVASTLTERLKNAKDYAKNLGKASIPSFVGMAAFTGLMEGIGWVMDEGGEIKRLPSPDPEDNTAFTHKYCSQTNMTSNCVFANSGSDAASKYYDKFIKDNYYHSYIKTKQKTNEGISSGLAFESWSGYSRNAFDTADIWWGITIYIQTNSNYTPPVPKPADDQEIQSALEQALSNNNPALAAAIADAIKSAYSYDGSEGQKPSANTLAKEAADDMSVVLPKAFDNPVPTSNPERPSGYYKITDGEKTVEGYVTPAPISGTTDTTTTPIIDPVTGQPTGETSTSGGFDLPPFCDWAAIVCDWIDWTKEEPDLPEEDGNIPNEILPAVWTPFELVNFDATCPPDIPLTMQIIGSPVDSIFPMQPFCTFFSGMQPFVLLLSMILSVKIVAGSLNNTVF